MPEDPHKEPTPDLTVEQIANLCQHIGFLLEDDDEHSRTMLRLVAEHCDLKGKLAAQLRKLAPLVEAAKKIARHHPNCRYQVEPCDCGFWEFQQALKEFEQ